MGWILALWVGACSTFILIHNKDRTEFHGDETGWIASSFYYSGLLLKVDLTWEHWTCPELESWGAMNPQGGKWIMGIPLQLRFGDAYTLRIYDFNQSYDENVKAGNIPDPDVLSFARTTSAIVGGFCCMLLFLLGWRSGNGWIGVLASILLLGNQVFFIHATRAMTDISYNLFIICIALSCLVFLRAESQKARYYGCLLLGVCSGLAASVKVTGILVGGLIAVGMFTYRAILDRTRRNIFLYLLVFGLAGLATIYALNPYYWPDVAKINGPELVRELPALTRDLWAHLKAGQVPAGDWVEANYPQLINLSHPFLFPVEFIEWHYIMEYMQRIPSAGWNGNRLAAFHRYLLVDAATFPGEAFFLIVGLVVCVKKIRVSLKERSVSMMAVPLVFFAGNYLFLLCFMKLNWDRYYLPAIIAGRLLVAIGIYALCARLYHLVVAAAAKT